MTMVKIAMPSPNTATVRKTLPSGMTIRVSEPIASPTPAAANSTPSEASICGSTAAQPIASISRRPSCSGAIGGRPQPGEDRAQREQHAEAEEDIGFALGLDPADAAERRVIVGKRADQRGHRDDQRRQEQLVAKPVGPGLPLRLAGRRRVAAADEAEPGEPGQAEHQQPVAEIADRVAAEQAQRHQPPEGGIAEALGVGPVERGQQREGREHRARRARRASGG